MDELDLLAMDLRDEFDHIPEECFDLRLRWLRVMLDVELVRLADDNGEGLIHMPKGGTVH